MPKELKNKREEKKKATLTPKERALNRPPPGNHLEALPLFIGRGLQVDVVRLLQASHPLLEPLGRIGTINPYGRRQGFGSKTHGCLAQQCSPALVMLHG